MPSNGAEGSFFEERPPASAAGGRDPASASSSTPSGATRHTKLQPVAKKPRRAAEASSGGDREDVGARFAAGAGGSNPRPVGGRLRHFVDAWRALGDSEVLSIISHGLRLELLSLPEQERLPHRLLGPEQQGVFAQEIDELLLKRGIKVLDFYQEAPAPRTHVAVGFCVPKPCGWRPVIDWRDLNEHVMKRHFKMESLETVRQLIRRRDFLVKIDIKDAYLHVPIAEEHQSFLRFNFNQRTYQCMVMLFGLTSAPRVFTRVMLPVVRKLRDEGIWLVIYLDDILILAESQETALRHRDRTLQLLQELGWLVNWEKSVLQPARLLTYLGVQIDSENMTFSLPTEKLTKLSKAVAEMLDAHRARRLSLRQAAKVLGSMTAAAAGIELARLHERPLLQEVQQALSEGAQWEAYITLSRSTCEACSWWRNEIMAWNGIRIIEPATVTHVLTTDASAEGYGVTIKALDASLDLHTQWKLPATQATRTSNWRELSAIAFALKRLGPAIRGASLRIRSDNATALACIRNQGSRWPELTDIARATDLPNTTRHTRASLRTSHGSRRAVPIRERPWARRAGDRGAMRGMGTLPKQASPRGAEEGRPRLSVRTAPTSARVGCAPSPRRPRCRELAPALTRHTRGVP